uniref:Myosin heavy chain, striated muscle n=1 Tax=Solanum tuberosum TaxID=4113 RepID=M1CBA5_SOLTU
MKRRSSVAKRQAMAANSPGLENNQTGKLNAGAAKKRLQVYDVLVDLESGDKIVNIDTNTYEPLRICVFLSFFVATKPIRLSTRWEKAESEAAILKNHLESITLLKLTAEDKPFKGSFSHEANHLPRLASMSEDGNDDNVSCASSWTTALRSDLSHIKKEKNSDSPHKSESASHLDLMDDFLEMEKLAYQSSDTNGAVSSPDIPNNARPETTKVDTSMHVTTSPDSQLKEHNETNKSISMKLQSRISTVLESLSKEVSSQSHQPLADKSISMKPQSRISTVLESLSKEADIQRIQEDLREIVQEMRNAVILQSTKSIVEITLSSKTATESQSSLDDGEANLDKEIPVSEDIKSCNESIMVLSSGSLPYSRILYPKLAYGTVHKGTLVF